MKGSTCMYCYDGLCFKAGKAEKDMLAIPCNGCDTIDEAQEAVHLHIIT